MRQPRFHTPTTALALLLATALGLAACGGPTMHTREGFAEKTPFWQQYDRAPEEVCAAANLALLSQGYKTSALAERSLTGQKEFQPEKERHAILEFQISCRPNPQQAGKTMLFASATESHYALKESSSAAGVSIPKVGSISLPFSGSAESLVKINSATVDDAGFYRRFHELVDKYLGNSQLR